MNLSRYVLALLLAAAVAAGTQAQDEVSENTASPSVVRSNSEDGAAGPPVDNLFRRWRDAVAHQSAQGAESMMEGSGYPGMGSGSMGGYGGPGVNSSMGSGMGSEMEMGSGMEMGMGMMGGMPAAAAPTPSELFQQALQRAVQRLRSAKTEEEKQELLELVRSALSERYEQALTQREQELDDLEQRLQKLRTDLERRRQAQQKVIDVQLQTVELAGEGLVETGR